MGLMRKCFKCPHIPLMEDPYNINKFTYAIRAVLASVAGLLLTCGCASLPSDGSTELHLTTHADVTCGLLPSESHITAPLASLTQSIGTALMNSIGYTPKHAWSLPAFQGI
jgi:hypothetical protein